MGTQPRPFAYVLSMVDLELLQQSRVILAKTMWSQEPKILTTWPFAEEVS